MKRTKHNRHINTALLIISTILFVDMGSLDFAHAHAAFSTTTYLFSPASSPGIDGTAPPVSGTVSPDEQSQAPEFSDLPESTPEQAGEKETVADSDIDYTPYFSVIIFFLAAILGVLIGHFVIYRIR